MSQDSIQENAVEELQQLGLREYEAKCFVALTKLPSGTAREVSEQIDVPRTRVYEAVRSLESRGLVEIQHSTPQRFRSIPVPEAVRLLDSQRQKRIETLEQSLETLTQRSTGTDLEEPKIWSLSDEQAIETRVETLVSEAQQEVLLLLGKHQAVRDGLTEKVQGALNRDLDVVVGAASDSLRTRLTNALPEEVVYQSGLNWLEGPDTGQVSLGRLLLIDEQRLLTSTVVSSDGTDREWAVCGTGACNGLVVVLQQLLYQALDPEPASMSD